MRVTSPGTTNKGDNMNSYNNRREPHSNLVFTKKDNLEIAVAWRESISPGPYIYGFKIPSIWTHPPARHKPIDVLQFTPGQVIYRGRAGALNTTPCTETAVHLAVFPQYSVGVSLNQARTLYIGAMIPTGVHEFSRPGAKLYGNDYTIKAKLELSHPAHKYPREELLQAVDYPSDLFYDPHRRTF